MSHTINHYEQDFSFNNDHRSTELTPQKTSDISGRTITPCIGSQTSIELVWDKMLLKDSSSGSTMPSIGQGGWMRDFYSELADQNYKEQRLYPSIDNGKSELNSYEVSITFDSFLKKRGTSGIRELVKEYGVKDVRNAVKEGAFVQHAAQEGHLDLVRYLVDELKCDPNVFHDKESPLISAVKTGNIKLVSLLLERSSARSFRDKQPFEAGVITHANINRHKGKMVPLLVKARNKYPITIAGSLPATGYIVRTNREKITNWLKKEFKMPVGSKDSDASLLAKVVEVATTRDKQALFQAVRRNDPVIVDLLVAAGAFPDQTNSEGQTPGDLTKNDMIKRRLRLAQDLQNSFRGRQINHLLKNYAAEKMSPEDEVASWSNLIATLEATPNLQPELQQLAIGLRKSLALKYVLKNTVIPKNERKKFLNETLKLLKVGEWVIVNEPRSYGHHIVTMIEKQKNGGFLFMRGDRYRSGSDSKQIGDDRTVTNNLKNIVDHFFEQRDLFYHQSFSSNSPNQQGKISKKWQGTENNCVTQSDTVLFDYLLGEKFGRSKVELYRQLKPLRLAFLTSSLKKQGVDRSPHNTLNWFQSSKHNRLTELYPLIISKDAYHDYNPSNLLDELNCFISADSDGMLSLWEKGSKVPTKTCPWMDWKTMAKNLPRESWDPARRLYIKRIKRLTGQGTHLTFSVNSQNEGVFTCDLFSPSVSIKCRITPTGAFIFKGANGEYSKFYNNFDDLWSNLPNILVNNASDTNCIPRSTIIKNWAHDVVQTAYKKAYRSQYQNLAQKRPQMGADWINLEEQIVNSLESNWTNNRKHVIKKLLGFTAPTLTEYKQYQSSVYSYTSSIIKLIESWVKPSITQTGMLWFKKEHQSVAIDASKVSMDCIQTQLLR